MALLKKRFPVQLNADQFDRLARPTLPVAGIAELIWNALDAEAEEVKVELGLTELSAIESVTVIDDGHGMSHAEATDGFSELGGSWKKKRERTRNDLRALHGKEGVGRFRAFAIGGNVEWVSLTRLDDESLERTLISGSLDNSEFSVDDAEVLDSGKPGTVVTIQRPRQHVSKLLSEDAVPWLVSQFAVYLLNFPAVRISYEGKSLDPKTIIQDEAEFELDLEQDLSVAPILKIIEWSAVAKSIKPSLVLCGSDWIALEELADGIETPPDFRYTAYVSWPGFSDHASELLVGDMAPAPAAAVIEAARNQIASYLDERLTTRRAEVIDRWKAEHVYPYEDEVATPAEAQERKVFDAIASVAAPAVSSDTKAARLSLRLIKEALAQPPGALHRVLSEVLELSPEQLEDFDRLLDRTSLAAIIHTSKVVTDRFDFLHDLEGMLFDREKQERLLERSQLHRVLANRGTWLFGERYRLGIDDKGLTKLLEEHWSLLGDERTVSEPVTDVDGHTRIIDLMFWKATHEADRRHHLVVELKRPSLKLSQTELTQIANYAVTINRDKRFRTPDVTWDFWLLGDDMDEVVEDLVNQKDSPSGLYVEGSNYRIWVRRWAEILEENRQRLHFFREHLKYVEPTDEAELDAVVDKYLSQPTAVSG